MKDNGLGIRDEDQGKLFKIFSPVVDLERGINTEGIGIGLVICRMIVEQFHGTIGFTSRYLYGSTFRFEFEVQPYSILDIPEAADELDLIESVDDVELAPTASVSKSFFESYSTLKRAAAKRILVVDDEEFCISTMKLLLNIAGIKEELQVDYAITGSEAVDRVQEALEHGICYRVIFTDFNMPVMNGIQATEHILRLCKDYRLAP